jgi:hypothetical protein
VSADDLQAEIRRLLRILGKAEQPQRGLYRSLCALARKRGVDPEEFRQRLVMARLPESRASEIKCVLSYPEAYRPFLAGEASWHDSLNKARELARAEELTPIEAVAARLVALLYRRALRLNPAAAEVRQTSFEHPHGIFELTALAVQLEPPAHE